MDTGEINLSDESSSDENDTIWQIVPTKRKKLESPKLHQQKRRNTSCEPSTSANNKYAALSIDDDEECEPAETTIKPPPIYIPNVQNISVMLKKN